MESAVERERLDIEARDKDAQLLALGHQVREERASRERRREERRGEI